jgi:hypothetical protein
MSSSNTFTVLKDEQKKLVFDKLKTKKGIAYYRKGSYSDEIIWQDRKFLFPSPLKKIQSGMWVFRSVLNDVKNYVIDKKIIAKKQLPVNFWNEKNKKYRGKITATDLDHAYWRIAYLEGIIKPKTYENGLKIKDKSVRLAALANLSSSKEYQIIIDGVLTEKTKVFKYNQTYHKVYNNIRYTCYEHMNILAEMLGEDFICYKTDCIYYKDNPKNRELVQVYLDSVNMEWKQLVEPDKKEMNNEVENQIIEKI